MRLARIASRRRHSRPSLSRGPAPPRARSLMPASRHEGARLVPASGAGVAAATAAGRRANPAALPDAKPPKWAPPPALRAVPKTAAAALDLELRRAKAVSRLRKKLEAACGKAGLAIDGPGLLTFERWLWSARRAAGARGGAAPPPGRGGGDPVLPPAAAEPDLGLVNDLKRRGAPADAAAKAAAELAAAAAATGAALAKRARALQTGAPPDAIEVTIAVHARTVELVAAARGPKVGGGGDAAAPPPLRQAAFARLSLPAYATAAARYTPATGEPPAPADAAAGAADPAAHAAFHRRLLAALLRYKTLRGGGFHAGVGEPLAAVLKERLGCAFECFASSLNALTPRFGTAFPDVDAVFGGTGDFFGAALPAGAAVSVNPPFEPATLAAAAAACVAAVAAADAAKSPLTIAFVCPAWREGAAWKALSAPGVAEATVVAAAADHGFRDGAPHGAADPYRQSPYDSGLFVLRSKAAAAKRPLDAPAFEAAVRAAWAACCPSPAAVARQRAGRGSKDVRAWGDGPAAPAQKKRPGAGTAGGGPERKKRKGGSGQAAAAAEA